MESNSDKEMRDKLRGIEPAFDPKAWEQMEAMLEKDRKPMPFLWWWFGGVAACLMLGFGIYGYNQYAQSHYKHDNIFTAQTKEHDSLIAEGVSKIFKSNNSPANHGTTSNPNPEISNNTLANTQPKYITNKATPASSRSKANTAALTTKLSPVNSSATNSRRKQNKETAATTYKADNNASHKKHTDRMASSSFINDGAIKGNNSNEKQPGNSLQTVSAAGSLDVTNFAIGLTDFLVARAKEELSEIALMCPDTLTAKEENDDADMTKKENSDVDLKRLKKKLLFNASLGIAANVTGTTLGNQGTGALFYKKPSYMAGITSDFMFQKRIAITTGLMFSQTSFMVNSPESFSSNITELNIPVGIKGYLVSKSKVRFYIGVGIINHIKLKETFAYNNVPYTMSNSFGGSTLVSLTNSFSDPSQSASSNYSINKGKRYYASFYATAGAEFIVKQHLVFFTEPLFYMGLEKIGSLNKYKYNLGLSGGFRYQF